MLIKIDFPADASEGSRNIKLMFFYCVDGTCLIIVMSQRAYLGQFDQNGA